METFPSPAAPPAGRFRLQATGVLLFLFIPLVLFLFVRHPQPVGASLAAGLVLMVGHRLLARPYMARAMPWKCLWCNRIVAGSGETLELRAGGETLAARCCAGHRPPAARFFGFLAAWRWPLRLGIFVPLLLLLAALAAAAAGQGAALPRATALFQLLVGVTVNLAAFGYLGYPPEREPGPVPFPVHNFFLLGVRNLLWVFRLVGIWWIAVGAAALLAP